jgi:hypothetical protein
VSTAGEPLGELDVIRNRTRAAWDWLEETVADVDAELANWWPPGTANSIGASYLHVVINADVELATLIGGRTPLLDGDWGGDVGQGPPYEAELFDRWVRHQPVDWAVLRRYGRAVHHAVVELFDALTPDRLDLPVDMSRAGLGTWEARDLCYLHGIEHVRIHGGEIACVKGLRGGTGWPEPAAFRAAIVVIDVEPEAGGRSGGSGGGAAPST